MAFCAGNKFFESASIHLHVPEGATPKDGPSAGVTMVSSLLSLALDQPVAADVAMTGEITLTGKVLGVGGIKEKLLAARQADYTTICLPAANRKDVLEIEKENHKLKLLKGLKIHYIAHFSELFDIVFKSPAPSVVAAKGPKRRKSGDEGLDRLGPAAGSNAGSPSELPVHDARLRVVAD
jgi:ATP-dependent Lon protease